MSIFKDIKSCFKNGGVFVKMAKNNGNGAEECCNGGKCHRCWGGIALVVGILILLNAIYGKFSWAVFIGGLIAIKGIVMLVMPHCPHCK